MKKTQKSFAHPNFIQEKKEAATRIRKRALKAVAFLRSLPDTPTSLYQADRYKHLGCQGKDVNWPFFNNLLTCVGKGSPKHGKPKEYVVNRPALAELEQALRDAGVEV